MPNRFHFEVPRDKLAITLSICSAIGWLTFTAGFGKEEADTGPLQPSTYHITPPSVVSSQSRSLGKEARRRRRVVSSLSIYASLLLSYTHPFLDSSPPPPPPICRFCSLVSQFDGRSLLSHSLPRPNASKQIPMVSPITGSRQAKLSIMPSPLPVYLVLFFNSTMAGSEPLVLAPSLLCSTLSC